MGQPSSQPTPAMPGDGMEQEAGTSGGYCIELKVGADGSIKVSVEPASAEVGEEAESDEEYQSVPNIREAIKLVIDIYNNQGQTQDTGANDAEMAKGYA